MKIQVLGIPTEHAQAIRRGDPDANGQVAVSCESDGVGNPCRHCLELIAAGEPMYVLAYRPFAQVQPYAEVGPVFLHQRDCPRHTGDALPAWFDHLQPALIRGYRQNHWIAYHTGQVVDGKDLGSASRQILADPDVAYVHVRSRFNCFQCRIERG